MIEEAKGRPGTGLRERNRGRGGSRRRASALEWLAEHRLVVTRWALVICQAATIWVTWRLWNVRTSPPMLPVLDLPGIPVGWPLLVSLLVLLRFPVAGAVGHSLVLGYAFAADQTRMQPEVMSMGLLLLAVSGPRSLLFLGRVHLVTLWVWAGLAKLISADFMSDTGAWMFDGLFFQPPPGLRPYFGAIVIFLELGAGTLALFRDLRPFSAGMAVLVHAGALLVLGPLGRNWNSSIWPWNAALAICALLLIAPWGQDWKSAFASVPPAVRVVAALLILFPALFYVGQADAYPAHHLYSADTARGYVCTPEGRCSREPFRRTWEELNVPLPPEHRLFRALFDLTCRPGEVLRIEDRRRGPRWNVPPHPCPRGAPLDQSQR